MPFDIIPVKSFLNDLKSLSKKYPSLKDDIDSVVGELKSNPKIGEPLGKDCYNNNTPVKI